MEGSLKNFYRIRINTTWWWWISNTFALILPIALFRIQVSAPYIGGIPLPLMIDWRESWPCGCLGLPFDLSSGRAWVIALFGAVAVLNGVYWVNVSGVRGVHDLAAAPRIIRESCSICLRQCSATGSFASI